jgi:hypothetical protein
MQGDIRRQGRKAGFWWAWGFTWNAAQSAWCASRSKSGKAMIRLVAAVGAGTVCGLAWGMDDRPGWALAAAFMPLVWFDAGSRLAAGAVALAYYLAASRGIPFGAGIFFAESAPQWFSWALWIGAGVLNAGPWILCWSQRPRQRLLGLPLAVTLSMVPPMGLIGWTNPILAAGWIFPGLGFVGLALLVWLWMAIATVKPVWVVGLLVAAVAANEAASERWTPKGWMGINTEFGRYRVAAGVSDFLEAFRRLQTVKVVAAELAPGSVAVMPETVLGLYTEVTATELADVAAGLTARGSAVLVGAGRAHGTGFENGLVVLGEAQRSWISQRIPVPVGMWRPWAADSVAADPWGSGVVMVAGKRVAVLICYEELLVWPALVSMAQRPEVIVGAANDWWARDTSIPAIQRQSLVLWGRLFAIPVIAAVNT